MSSNATSLNFQRSSSVNSPSPPACQHSTQDFSENHAIKTEHENPFKITTSSLPPDFCIQTPPTSSTTSRIFSSLTSPFHKLHPQRRPQNLSPIPIPQDSTSFNLQAHTIKSLKHQDNIKEFYMLWDGFQNIYGLPNPTLSIGLLNQASRQCDSKVFDTILKILEQNQPLTSRLEIRDRLKIYQMFTVFSNGLGYLNTKEAIAYWNRLYQWAEDKKTSLAPYDLEQFFTKTLPQICHLDDKKERRKLFDQYKNFLKTYLEDKLSTPQAVKIKNLNNLIETEMKKGYVKPDLLKKEKIPFMSSIKKTIQKIALPTAKEIQQHLETIKNDKSNGSACTYWNYASWILSAYLKSNNDLLKTLESNLSILFPTSIKQAKALIHLSAVFYNKAINEEAFNYTKKAIDLMCGLNNEQDLIDILAFFSENFPESQPEFERVINIFIQRLHTENVSDIERETTWSILAERGYLSDIMQVDQIRHLLNESLQQATLFQGNQKSLKDRLGILFKEKYSLSLLSIVSVTLKNFKSEIHKLQQEQLCSFEALILTCLKNIPSNTSHKYLRTHYRDLGLNLLNLLYPNETYHLSLFAFKNPQYAAQLCQYAWQERIELSRGGDNDATFKKFAQALTCEPSKLPNTRESMEGFSITELLTIQSEDSRLTAYTSSGDPQNLLGMVGGWKACGRTVVYHMDNQRIIGLKVMKKGNADNLVKEDQMNRYLSRLSNKLRLQSKLPTSAGITLLKLHKDFIEAIEKQAEHHGQQQFSLMNIDGDFPVLLYSAEKDYQVHLHEIPEFDALKKASYTCLHDAGVLASRLGLVCKAPADLYHNDAQNRSYHWNVDHVGAAVGQRFGTGRLDQWEDAIRTINMGATGLRDLKHYVFIDDIVETYHGNRPLALTSTMGNFLFAWSLSVGKWFLDHKKFHDVDSLKILLIDGFTTYFSAYTGLDKDESNVFMEAIINWSLIAQQMCYFMSGKYKDDLVQAKIQDGIFGSDVQVYI